VIARNRLLGIEEAPRSRLRKRLKVGLLVEINSKKKLIRVIEVLWQGAFECDVVGRLEDFVDNFGA
jgi:hypothetical protein